MNKYLEYTLVSPFPVGVGMQDHGKINRRKFWMAGVRATERRFICVETSCGCLKGTDVGKGSFR